jgi:microcystin-dependent protein
MGTPYLCELRLISWNYAPRGWAFCDGQTLPINQNQAIFSLLGTTYGGNGQTTFVLPNLQGRIPIHFGSGFTQGQIGGETSHTLTVQELPQHNHLISASSAAPPGDAVKPTGNLLTTTDGNLTIYKVNPGTTVAMDPASIANQGGSQPHQNEQPYLVLNWIIALQGIFPSRN